MGEKAPKMLTIHQVAATGILTENALRAGVKAGWVPHIKIGTGRNVLINYDRLIDYLNGKRRKIAGLV